jgi:hypothetical protein
MAEMTRLLLASNGGEGTTIDLKELNELTIRVTLALEIRGIELDREAFMAMVRKDSNISRVLQRKSTHGDHLALGAHMFANQHFKSKYFC